MDALAGDFRAKSLQLRAITTRDLITLWPSLEYGSLDATFPTLLTRVAPLVQRDRNRQSGLASLYLKEHRAAAKVAGTAPVRQAPRAPSEQIVRSLHATSVEAAKVATRAGFDEKRAMQSALVQTVGSMTRLVMNAGRDTVIETATSDPRCRGWQRVGVGECDFCSLLLSRGAVYTEATADFAAHDHCSCSAEPVYT